MNLLEKKQQDRLYLGTHLLCEYYECDSSKIDDIEIISDALITAANKCKVTILEKSFHKFSSLFLILPSATATGV